MSTALTIFDQPNMALPAHIGSFFGEERNVLERNTTPTLGVTGKVWTITVNGESTKLTKVDAEGDEVPMSIMRVVILDYGKRRGRSFYEGNYDPNNTAKPKCWSDDGLAPSGNVKEPIASKCDKCPMAIKGSKVTDNGVQTTACSQHRILAVVPANKLDFPALRFKIAITSDYDDKSPELAAQNWYAFKQLLDLMQSKGVQHTAALVVKMKFDPNAAYPKVLFSPDRWLNAEEIAVIRDRIKSEEVQNLINGVMATDTTPDTAEPATPAPKAVPMSKTLTPPPASKAVIEDDEDEAPAPAKPAKAKVVVDEDEEEVEIQTPPKPAPKKAAKPAPAPVTADEDEDEAPAPKKAKKAAATPAAVATEVPADVESLLADWGDD